MEVVDIHLNFGEQQNFDFHHVMNLIKIISNRKKQKTNYLNILLV